MGFEESNNQLKQTAQFGLKQMGGTETPTKKNRGVQIINDSLKKADDLQTSQSLTYDVRPRIIEFPSANDSIRVRTKKNNLNNDVYKHSLQKQRL